MTKNHIFASFIVLFFTSISSFSQTFNGTTGPITDNNCATTPNTFSTTVSGIGTLNGSSQNIAYINVDITHTYIGDISLALQNVNTGTTVQLVSPDIGDGGDNYTNTVFTPGSNAPISTGVAPYSAGYLPEGDLTNFNGENADGTWNLIVCDNYAVDTGTLNSWSITFATIALNNVFLDGYGYPINTGTQFSDFPVIANNIGATDSESSFPLGIPSGCGTTDNGGYRGGDIWYVAFVSANGTLTIETAASSGSNITDTAIAVYEDLSLVQIACNDDKSGTDPFSKIEIGGLTPGAFIFIRAWSKNYNTFGEFQISAYANNTYVPDDNFENYLETHDASGTLVLLGDPTSMGNGIINDDFVPTLKINTVTALDVNSLSITDLTGIEDFVALESLICYSNQLPALNINQNTALEYLNCGDNPINNLDVTQNTALTYLRCNNNGLTTLDVSNNTLLGALRCEFNAIATLNLSQNTALAYLRCDNNTLSELDTSQNTALIYLRSDNNTLSELDTSQNTALTYLRCDNNTLSELDTSLNTALTYIRCNNNTLSNLDTSLNTSLEVLICSNNSITSLGMSQNTALTYLSCNNNQLTLLDIANGNNTNVTYYDSQTNPDLSCIKVDDAAYANTNWSGFKDPASSFSEDCGTYVPDDNFENYLETHNASGTSVTLGDPTSMGNGIANDNYVTTANINTVTNLNVTNKNITDLTGIEDFTNLDVLNCTNNVLTSLNISENLVLRILNCYNNNLEDLDLSANSALETLDCSDNNLGSLDVASNTALINLICHDINISSLDISNNTTLDILYCYNNNLTSLNIANGNNTNITEISTISNPNLFCIQVDDITYSNNNWFSGSFFFQTQNYFSIDCNLNDTPEKAYTLNVGHDFVDQAQIGDNTNATASEVIDPTLLTPTCSAYAGQDLWYAIEIPDDGSVIIETGIDLNYFDTALALYAGTPGSLTEIDCNDDITLTPLQNLYSQIILTGRTPGEIIYARVWEYESNAIGTFQISAYRNPAISTYVPDDAFEFYLEFHDATGAGVGPGNPNNMGNGSFDDYVPTAKINTVTSLNVDNSGIADLTGIEAFISLNSLDCPNNALTEIDISKNTNLVWFNCRSNFITNLDTTLNTGLTGLDFGNNQISNIDLSNNLSLEYLSCFLNLLTSVDLSSFNSLTTIYVDNNRLTSLNIANGNNINLTNFNLPYNPELTCVTVDNQTIADNWNNGINTPPNDFNIDSHTSFSTNCNEVVVEAKAYLQGAYLNPRIGEEAFMRDDLRALSYLPTVSPYDATPLTNGTEFTVIGTDAIVDWVWVELRDNTDNTLVIEGQSALMQRDGDIVALDGVNPLVFAHPAKYYKVVIKHRNHLGIMTGSSVAFPKDQVIDFKTGAMSSHGTNGEVNISGTYALWAGNVNNDGIIQYTGTDPDTPSILSEVLNALGNFLGFPTYIINGYNVNDINMDGDTQYSGVNPDTPFILQNVLAHPGNFLNFSTHQILEQLPEN